MLGMQKEKWESGGLRRLKEGHWKHKKFEILLCNTQSKQKLGVKKSAILRLASSPYTKHTYAHTPPCSVIGTVHQLNFHIWKVDIYIYISSASLTFYIRTAKLFSRLSAQRAIKQIAKAVVMEPIVKRGGLEASGLRLQLCNRLYSGTSSIICQVYTAQDQLPLNHSSHLVIS